MSLEDGTLQTYSLQLSPLPYSLGVPSQDKHGEAVIALLLPS